MGEAAPVGTLGFEVEASEISTEQRARLVQVLRAERGWLTAKEIAARMGEGVTDRAVRAIASAACPAVVSYPGSPGYRLWQHCEIGEIRRCIDSFESQGRDMFKRAIAYRRAYHGRFKGAPEDGSP